MRIQTTKMILGLAVLSACSSRPLVSQVTQLPPRDPFKEKYEADRESFKRHLKLGMNSKFVVHNLDEPDETVGTKDGYIVAYNDEDSPMLISYNLQDKVNGFSLNTALIEKREKRQQEARQFNAQHQQMQQNQEANRRAYMGSVISSSMQNLGQNMQKIYQYTPPKTTNCVRTYNGMSCTEL